MKSLEEMVKISNEYVGISKEPDNTEESVYEYQMEVLSNIMDNLTDNIKFNRCIRIGYLLPRYDGLIKSYQLTDDVDGFIDLRKCNSKPSEPYNKRIEGYFKDGGFKVTTKANYDEYPIMVISW
jgi:hypothetical protein